jgi:hypothetical protein
MDGDVPSGGGRRGSLCMVSHKQAEVPMSLEEPLAERVAFVAIPMTVSVSWTVHDASRDKLGGCEQSAHLLWQPVFVKARKNKATAIVHLKNGLGCAKRRWPEEFLMHTFATSGLRCPRASNSCLLYALPSLQASTIGFSSCRTAHSCALSA